MKVQEEVGRNVEMLSRQIIRRVNENVVNHDMTAKQGAILLYIHDESKKRDVYARDIETAFDMRRASVTGILQLMEKNGIIKREGNKVDARLKKLVLTDKAEKIRRNLKKEIKEIESILIDGISKEEIEMFLELTKKMSLNLCTKKEEDKK